MVDSRATFGAKRTVFGATVIGSCRPKFQSACYQFEIIDIDTQRQSKSARGLQLAVEAMAGIECQRLTINQVADISTLALARIN